MTDSTKKVSAFEIFLRMQQEDDQSLRLAPLSNITEARKVKHGTKITIGWGGDVVGQIMNNDFVGGLILCDRKRFEELKAEMENSEAKCQTE